MRLIDADKIINFRVTAEDGKKYVLLPVEKLDDIPTAFDNDLPIKMLEEEKEMYTRGYKECLACDFSIWENLKGRADGISKAIRIVKEYNANKLLQNMQQPRGVK